MIAASLGYLIGISGLVFCCIRTGTHTGLHTYHKIEYERPSEKFIFTNGWVIKYNNTNKVTGNKNGMVVLRMEWEISLLGLLVGLLVGMTGVGGAALLTPLLVLIGVNPSIAVGTDLFYNSVTKLFGTVQHWRQRTINKPLVRYLAYGSIPGAILSVVLLKVFESFFDGSESLMKHTLGIVLIIASLATLVKPLLKNKDKGPAKEYADENGTVSAQKKKLTIMVGFILGFIVGMTSIGSGSLFALAMLYLFRLKASEIVGTDIAHAFLLVTVAGILHASFGNVDFVLAGQLLIGSVPGVLLGSFASSKLPPAPLRTAMAGIILISGLKLI